MTEQGIEEKSDKCEVVIQMNSSSSMKEVQRLNNMLTALNRFISKTAQHTLPFYRLLKKKADFERKTDYEEVFKYLKKTLATPLSLNWSCLG